MFKFCAVKFCDATYLAIAAPAAAFSWATSGAAPPAGGAAVAVAVPSNFSPASAMKLIKLITAPSMDRTKSFATAKSAARGRHANGRAIQVKRNCTIGFERRSLHETKVQFQVGTRRTATRT